MTHQKTPPKEVAHEHKYGAECGTEHAGCINTINGTCDREPGHSGSHHCSSCNMSF